MPSGRVRPGEMLGYVERLRQRDLWPVTSINYDRGDPVATPYLAVPVAPDDNGVRPLAGDTALHNPNVEILHGAGTPVTQPVKGTPYTLRCTVRNLGAISAYAGLAEFYVATPSFFDQAAVTFRASMRAVGYAGFVALPGTDSVIDCPGFWTPGSDQEAASSVLVQVYDPFTDPLSYPFDAREDRHVGRRDSAPVVRMPIIPYRSAAYKYLVVDHDEDGGFEQLGFDDAGFSLGDAGFGTPDGFCSLNNPTDVKTTWRPDTDILLRKQFFLPAGTSNLEVRVAIDNDVQVFINGQDISRGLRTHEGCPSNDSFVFIAPDNLLVAGANLLAVRGRDRGVLCYLDVQVTATTP